METLENFNPLDVLAAAAEWQSANQITKDEPPLESDVKTPVPATASWATALLDHPYALVTRDDQINGYDDVDSATCTNGAVTSEPETTDSANDNQLYIVIDDELGSKEQDSSRECLERSALDSDATTEPDGAAELSMGLEASATELALTDGDDVTPRELSGSALHETNNNDTKPSKDTHEESRTVDDGVTTPIRVEISEPNLDDISKGKSSIPELDIPDQAGDGRLKSPRSPALTPESASPKAALLAVDHFAKMSKAHALMVARREGLLSDKLVSPPVHEPRHTCVSLDCCSPSDITAVARDLCVDRLSSASSQDLYTEDGQESPRSMKLSVSPPGKIRRQQRGAYKIPLGPLLSDAHDRPEHPLKDHDYCLHSFYLAMTHNRIDEPVRRPGPQPKCKEQKFKRKAEKAKCKKKRRSKDDFDSDLSPFKEDVFSDTDSFTIDSPSKSRMSSPTNSVASSLDLSRERMKTRDKRLNSLPSFLDKPKESMAMSNFNDNYVFFGKKPKRRNRTLVENNHDKLKKFNHSEFLPGLDISYLEARAKFHKKVVPEIKTELPKQDLTSGSELTSNPETTPQQEVNLPKGGLAFGISEEESQFIDSLHCDAQMDGGFHHEEITHEQVKELLTAVGVDALKLIEGTADLHSGHDLDSLGDGHLTIGTEYQTETPNTESTQEPASAEVKSEPSLCLDLPATTGSVSMETSTGPTDTVKTESPVRPKDLPFSPLKPGMDLPLSDPAIPHLGSDLGEVLAPAEMNDASLLGATTPELNLNHVADLTATTPDLPLGGTTPHDLLDLDDTDLLNANLNLNMNLVLNFQSPEKVYHPSAAMAAPARPPIGLAQRKLDLDLGDSLGMDKGRGYVRNNPQTMGKPDQVLKSQMFKNLSQMGEPESQDHGVPELITVNMYWNDLPGLLINGKQYVRLVDIHKQVLPAKPTGLLKNRCRALGMEIQECTELQRDFLIRYAHAAASRSQIIVTKDVAETLIGYYVDKPPVKKADDSASLADGSTYSYTADDIARLEDVMKPKKKRKERKFKDAKPRGRPKGATIGSSSVNITFKLAGEVFQKRVQTSGFSLLCGDTDTEDSDSDVDQRISSAAARFQKILNLRAQIKAIRAEIYAIQKRQQRAEIRKSKGLAKGQRAKPAKRMVIPYEAKRLLKSIPRAALSGTALHQPVVEKLLPTVRVAPNNDSSTRSSTTDSPVPTAPNVIVESCAPFNAVPSAIVTPMHSRLEDDSSPSVDTSLNSSYLDTDISKQNSDLEKFTTEKESETSFDCSGAVLVKFGEESAASRPVPAFRCSTPSDSDKPPSRLAVQHYTGGHDCQNGYLYLNMFVSTKSSCIRCATCFQLMTVTEFLNHLHSSDDVATLIRHSIAKPRNLVIQDDQFLSAHQRTLWQQFESKSSGSISLSPIRNTLKKKETGPKRKLKQNVQLSRVGRARTGSLEQKVAKTENALIKQGRVADRRASMPGVLGKASQADSSRYSGRVRKRKQFSPDEGYTLPKVEPKLKRARSDAGLLTKRNPVVRISPLSTNNFGRPVCKVSPRPVAKISPVQSYKTIDARHRNRSGQR